MPPQDTHTITITPNWPNTYETLHAAARRAIQILYEHRQEAAIDIATAFAQDPTALIEFAAAIGKLDDFTAAMQQRGEGP